jgi:hypothetical protein
MCAAFYIETNISRRKISGIEKVEKQKKEN